MAKVLGAEEIGLKILPGMIPLLITGTYSRQQFKEMIGSVRRLLDQIEQHRDKDLREMGSDFGSENKNKQFDFDSIEQSMGIQKEAPIKNPTSQDVFDFLNSLEGSKGNSMNSLGNNNTRQGAMSNESPDDIFSSFNKPAP